ncbi:uncharacterized protein CMU_000520 [Cryptosporidium muris RN66]|uniref:Leucine rich repeat family protein n=1 Tax=Cryptosporidium muris (strain RN66) TaxID=441375 RepID=B6AG41_CRYMR|nr:uncharacterized protein CMU_000520 [Cryptosporidium muris RN66]EEA07182.1 leucine rich repeat family protein [Cryptosporidium muris RN66]|eukprot:XP_002141531.1 hypothetical protein [Cryptosporidium muris RN66]
MVTLTEQIINDRGKISLDKTTEFYTLSLRGLSITKLESLGTTRNIYECIDLSNNYITELSSIPYLSNLKSLILCNNQIEIIEREFISSLPNLESLVLTHNNLSSLESIISIIGLKKIKRISISDNPVSLNTYYRLFLIYFLPSLRYIDFQKICKEERVKAEKFFTENPTRIEILNLITTNKIDNDMNQNLAVNGSIKDIDKKSVHLNRMLINTTNPLNQQTINKIKNSIASCTSIDELRQLEQALITGLIPIELKKLIEK